MINCRSWPSFDSVGQQQIESSRTCTNEDNNHSSAVAAFRCPFPFPFPDPFPFPIHSFIHSFRIQDQPVQKFGNNQANRKFPNYYIIVVERNCWRPIVIACVVGDERERVREVKR